MTPPLPDLILHTRAGCHLCDETKAMLLRLVAERAARGLGTPRLVEVDIEADDALQREMLELIPVVQLGERRLELAVSPRKVRRFVEDALDRIPTAGA